MIVKVLGILDILAAVLFWLFVFLHIIPSDIILILAFYLLVKGSVFLISRDIASILDITSSLIIFLSLNFQIPKFITILVTLFLLQKGLISLAS